VSEGDVYYLAVLTFAVLWSVLSAVMLIGSAYEQNREEQYE
jgi:hypothetical protein